MARSNTEYSQVIVESFKPTDTRGLHGEVHIRPVEDQGFPEGMFVECSKELVHNYPVGTKFLIRAKVTDRQGSRPFLYSHYKWPYVVVNDTDERSEPSSKTKSILIRAQKPYLPDTIDREMLLAAMTAYDDGVGLFLLVQRGRMLFTKEFDTRYATGLA
jgi:hypothetical protein